MPRMPLDCPVLNISWTSEGLPCAIIVQTLLCPWSEPRSASRLPRATGSWRRVRMLHQIITNVHQLRHVNLVRMVDVEVLTGEGWYTCTTPPNTWPTSRQPAACLGTHQVCSASGTRATVLGLSPVIRALLGPSRRQLPLPYVRLVPLESTRPQARPARWERARIAHQGRS